MKVVGDLKTLFRSWYNIFSDFFSLKSFYKWVELPEETWGVYDERGVWLYLASYLRIKSSCSSQVEISQTLLEIALNFIYFTDFYFVETLTSLFSFFSTLFSHAHCYLKLMLFRLENHEFSRFFLCGELYRFKDIDDLDLTNFQIQAHHKKLLKEHVTY